MSARADDNDRSINARSLGLLAAAILSVLVGAVLLYAIVFAPDPSLRSAAPLEDVELPDEATLAASREIRDIRDIVQASEEGRIELYDEQGDIAQIILYDRFEPLAEGRFRITRPRATVFLEDGRTVHLRADTGDIIQRQQGREPDAGRFEGDVQAHLFDGPDLSIENGDAPSASLFTDRLAFDTAIGEVRSESDIRVESPSVRFAGEGLTLLFSEQDRRLLYLRIERGEHLTFDPAAPASRAADDDDDEPAQMPSLADMPQPAPGEPREKRTDLYRASLAGPVTLSSGPRAVRADRLELWARLIDGRLAPDAILPIDEGPAPDARAAVMGPPDAPPPAPPQSPQRAGERVTLSWAGALEMRPLESAAEELDFDDLFLRFSAPNTGLVQIDDSELDAAGRCVALDYGFRSRRLTLAGLGPRSVTMNITDLARFETGRLEIDLARRLITSPTPGLVTAIGRSAHETLRTASGDIPPRDIAWTGGMAVALRSEDGRIEPESATFRTGVVARDADSSVSGELLSVALRAGDDLSIERVIVEGAANARSGDAGQVSADRLDLTLDPSADGGLGVPRIATAAGSVRASRGLDTLRAELAEVVFADDPATGKIRVETFSANLDVSVRSGEGPDAIAANADRIRATQDATVIDLEGAPASIQRSGARLSAASMRIDSQRRTLAVFGPGEATHRPQSAQTALGYDVLSVRWQSSMTFDDFAGLAEFAGDVVAAADQGLIARDTGTGERLIVELTPADPLQQGSAAETERQLVRATLHSAIEEGVGDQAAELQSRRYRPDEGADSGLALERLMFLSGERVVAEASEEALRVPGAGRLLIDDRTEAHADDDTDPTRASGATMFEWDGSLMLSRATGQALLRDRVRMRHRPLNADDVATLECERIEAEFTADVGELVRAQASGAVYAAQGAKQIVADALSYDALRAVATATANPGSVVTLFDDQLASPLTAESVLWDLNDGVVRALGSGPVRTDR